MIKPVRELSALQKIGRENVLKRYQTFKEDLDFMVCSYLSGEDKTLTGDPNVEQLLLFYILPVFTDPSAPLISKVIGGVFSAGYFIIPIALTVRNTLRYYLNPMGGDFEY